MQEHDQPARSRWNAGPPFFWAPGFFLLSFIVWRLSLRDVGNSNVPARSPDRLFLIAVTCLIMLWEYTLKRMFWGNLKHICFQCMVAFFAFVTVLAQAVNTLNMICGVWCRSHNVLALAVYCSCHTAVTFS